MSNSNNFAKPGTYLPCILYLKIAHDFSIFNFSHIHTQKTKDKRPRHANIRCVRANIEIKSKHKTLKLKSLQWYSARQHHATTTAGEYTTATSTTRPHQQKRAGLFSGPRRQMFSRRKATFTPKSQQHAFGYNVLLQQSTA